MSSYLNAVKSGKSVTTTPPVHQSEKLPPQTVVAPIEEEGEEVPLEEEVVEEPLEEEYESSQSLIPRGNKKNTGIFSRLEFDEKEKEDDWWRLFVVTVGPAGLCSFGLSCTYFYDKLLSPPEFWNLIQLQLPPIIKPIVNILVETSVENPGQEKILTLPITSLKQPYQKQHLVDYWLKILAKAESEREAKKNKDPTQQNLNATLNGGFNIEIGSGKNTQTIVYLQDLSVVHKVLNAINQLLLNRKTRTVKVPYRNGNIILSLYGRGGTSIYLNVKAGKDNIKAIFPLEDFANQSRKAAKQFVALVGYCRVYLRRPSNESTEKENWILSVLAHDSLNQDVIQIRNKLATGVVPDSTLPEHFQKKILMSKKKQNQDDIENGDIIKLILLNLPEHWDDANTAKDRLEKSATEQRENEKIERQNRRDRERMEANEKKKREKEEAEGKKNEETQGETHDQVPKKPKTKIVNRKEDDGWFKVTVVDEEGKELEKPKPEEKPQPKVKQSTKSNETTQHSNNIFTIADEEEDVISLSDYQQSLREAKMKGQPQTQPKNKQPRNKHENKENGKEPVEKEIKKSAKNKAKKPSGEGKKPQAAVKDVPFWQNDLFTPLGYVFAFVAIISVIYLALN